MIGSYVSNDISSLEIDSEVSHFVHHFGLQDIYISLQANKNMSESQNEVMSWHLKSCVSMSYVQRLRRVAYIYERQTEDSL